MVNLPLGTLLVSVSSWQLWTNYCGGTLRWDLEILLDRIGRPKSPHQNQKSLILIVQIQVWLNYLEIQCQIRLQFHENLKAKKTYFN